MKQFNLDEYLKKPSRKVVTRDGRNARILCTDAKSYTPIIALVEISGSPFEDCLKYTENGNYYLDGVQSCNDLFFAPEKHEGWINIFKSSDDIAILGQYRIFESKKDAEKNGKDCKYYVATIKIEWEE